MKFFTSAFCSLLLAGIAYGQSLQITAVQTSFYYPVSTDWHIFNLGVSNTSVDTVPVRVRLDVSKMFKGHRTYFCFAQGCYEEGVIESPKGFTGTSYLASGKSDNSSFVGEFTLDGIEGTSTLTCTFFNDLNESDSKSVTLLFSPEVSAVKDEAALDGMSCSPNPVDGEVTFKGSFVPDYFAADMYWTKESTLRIFNVQGVEIGSTLFNADQVTISTAGFADGMYAAFVQTVSGVMMSTRFVVSH